MTIDDVLLRTASKVVNDDMNWNHATWVGVSDRKHVNVIKGISIVNYDITYYEDVLRKEQLYRGESIRIFEYHIMLLRCFNCKLLQTDLTCNNNNIQM